MGFSKAIMPTPKENESRQAYVSRCIPVRRREHPEEKQEERSIAACYGMYRQHKKGKGKK